MCIFKAIRGFRERAGDTARAAALGVLLTCGLAGAPPVFASAAQLNATLEPARIALDEAAQLTVTLHGAQPGEPALPAVNGLSITPVGQSSAVESVNGVTTASTSLTYRVTAQRPGRYTIPAVHYQGASTSALSLEVLPARTAAAGASFNPGSLPPPTVGAGTTQRIPDSGSQGAGRTTFLRVLLPKRQLYVGELVPVQIKAYFRADLGVTVDGAPTLQNDAFTVSNLTGAAQQSHEQIGGITYTTLSWYSGLVPIKSGSYTLAPELPVTLQIPQEPSASVQMPDIDALFGKSGFDSSFFDDANLQSLLGRTIERPLTLKAPTITLAVQALPAAGRPTDFSGAVGSFQMQSQASSTQVGVGDPLTVTLSIQGSGNFDRVSSSGLAADATWRTYRPQATFSAQDSVGLEGSKKFEQTVVPLRAGQVQLPALAFSYFDPTLRQYVERHTSPLLVSVTPGANGVVVAPASLQPAVAAGAGAALPGDPMAPLMLTMGPATGSLRPIVQRAWFFAIPGAPMAIMAGSLLLLRRRERAPVSKDAAVQAQVSVLYACMDDAQQAGDGAAFMAAARRALQIRLGQRWSLEPEAVTLAEVNARLDCSWDPLREVFAVAEQAAYAGWRPQLATLTHWRSIVTEQLLRVEQL